MWVFFSTLGMHSLWKNKGVQKKIPLQPGAADVTVEELWEGRPPTIGPW